MALSLVRTGFSGSPSRKIQATQRNDLQVKAQDIDIFSLPTLSPPLEEVEIDSLKNSEDVCKLTQILLIGCVI